MGTDMNVAASDRTERACLLVLALVTVTMLFLYGRIDYTNAAFKDWDSLIYLDMASASPRLDPDAPRPFAFRLLGPYLVGLIPGSTENAFLAVDLVLSFLLVYLMYRFLRYSGLRPPFACLATTLYILNKHFFGFTSWNYFHVNDVIMIILLIILFRSMMESRWLVFAAALCLGVATRETALIMIPVGLLNLAERRLLAREGGRFIAAIAPALAVFAAIRLLVHPATGPTLMQAVSAHWTKITSIERMYHILVNPFVPLALVPVVYFRRTFAFLKGRIHLAAFFVLIAGTTFFGHNNERLLNPASLAFYPLVGFILQDCVWPNRGMIALVVAGAFLSSLHWLVARYPLPSRGATAVLSGGSLVVITAALAVLQIVGKRRDAAPPSGRAASREGPDATACSRRGSS
ncbi:MAG: hypothetical protein NTW97_00890 [Candidatus Krumholzibacteria bacterium]|nr:hypothetical protein [Candidatus Krumholzibacteria bacterium]